MANDDWTELVLMTANVKGYKAMSRKQVRRAYNEVAKFGADLVAIQEAWLRWYVLIFRYIFRAHHYALGSPIHRSGTIIARKRRKFGRHRFGYKSHFNRKLHGTVRVSSGVVSWQRKVTGQRLRLKGTKYVVSFGSAHLTPSAFSNRFRGTDKILVRRAWDHGMMNLKNEMIRDLRTGCTHVIRGIDANASKAEVRRILGARMEGKPVHVYTSPHGWKIDHIVVVGEVRGLGSGIIKGVPGDHAPFWAKIRLVG